MSYTLKTSEEIAQKGKIVLGVKTLMSEGTQSATGKSKGQVRITLSLMMQLD